MFECVNSQNIVGCINFVTIRPKWMEDKKTFELKNTITIFAKSWPTQFFLAVRTRFFLQMEITLFFATAFQLLDRQKLLQHQLLTGDL